MTTTRPTDIPQWATSPSGGATVDEPPTGKQIQGWLPFEKPPSGAANWAWNRFASWVAQYASTGSAFPTLQGAANAPGAAPLNVGDSCLIDEPDGALPGGTVQDVAADVGVIFTQNVVDGAARSVVWFSGDIKVVERDGSGVIRSIPLTNPVTGVTALITDGDLVIIAYDSGTTSTVEAFTIDDGVQAWIVTPVGPAGIVNHMCMDADRVYLATDKAASELVALTRATGATEWAYDHAGVLWSVATNGTLVFAAGATSGHASNATLRGVHASDGFDFNGEGGLGTSPLAWNAVQAANTVQPMSIATDGIVLYATTGAGTATLEVWGGADGVLHTSRTIGTFPLSVAVDQGYVMAVTAEGTLGFTLTDILHAWTGEADGRAISDGAAVFTANGKRIARGNQHPMRFRRVDPSTESWLPLRQLLVPLS